MVESAFQQCHREPISSSWLFSLLSALSSGRLALCSGQSQPAGPNAFLQVATPVKRQHFFHNRSSKNPEADRYWPISESITATSEMECSDWPGLYHAPNLISRIGSAPPKLHELNIKRSLNKTGAQFLGEGMRASITRGVLSLSTRHSCGRLCLEPRNWAAAHSCVSAVAAPGVVVGWGTVTAPDGR